MAKLSAHGKELLRVEQELTPTDSDSLTTWERVTRSYHVDGKILQKHDVRFKPSQFHPEGERYSYGWKLHARLKKGVSMADHVAKVTAKISSGESKWRVVSGGPVVIIPPSLIMRAIESGESIGFCKECGRSQDGCEPDARNYQCESCGAFAVYGAEECLIAG